MNVSDDSPNGEEHDVKSHMLALNKVNIVAATTLLVLHVGNGRSENV